MHNEVRVLQMLFSHKLQHESGTSHEPKLWSGIVQPKVLGVGRRPQRTPYHFLTQVAFFASEVCLQLSHSRKDIVHASHNFFLFFLFPSQFLVGQINTRLCAFASACGVDHGVCFAPGSGVAASWPSDQLLPKIEIMHTVTCSARSTI